MSPTKILWSVSAAAAILAGASARAGCRCGIPPSPAGLPLGGGWNSYAATPGAYYGGFPGGPGPYSPYDAGMQPYGGQVATNGPHWAPGGYEGRIGSPAYYHDPTGGQYVVTGDPNYDHFGPGFHRHSVHGHYRYPYYNYRAPWYYPGRAVYNRNTNFAW